MEPITPRLAAALGAITDDRAELWSERCLTWGLTRDYSVCSVHLGGMIRFVSPGGAEGATGIHETMFDSDRAWAAFAGLGLVTGEKPAWVELLREVIDIAVYGLGDRVVRHVLREGEKGPWREMGVVQPDGSFKTAARLYPPERVFRTAAAAAMTVTVARLEGHR